MREKQRAKTSEVPTSTPTTSSNKKKARSSERLVQPTQQTSSNRKQSSTANNNSNKLITKRPQQSSKRAGKQVSLESSSVKGSSSSSSLKSASLKSSGKSGQNSLPANKKQQLRQQQQVGANKAKVAGGAAAAAGKSTRMTTSSASSERLQLLQQQPATAQVVSMTAAQAQSTAQTLASLLLSRCMSSSNCVHLLDVCTTKQAAIPLQQFTNSNTNNNDELAELNTSNNNNWSMPVGLMSSNIMSLTQALQADKVLKLFPQWKEAIENLFDHDAQSGYTLILPSNEAIDRLAEANVDAWLANTDLMAQIIDNHMIDSPELIEFSTNSMQQTANGANNRAHGAQSALARSRFIKSKALQVNQHRDKMVTINGKRLVYANQAAPCK